MFYFVTTVKQNKLVFVPNMPFKPSLIFANKVEHRKVGSQILEFFEKDKHCKDRVHL
jgi:hypothetical protein